MSSLVRAFSIDYRSLRFCRAALGVMTLVHAGHMFYDLDAFFTEHGLVPYDLVTQGGRYPFFLSFFYLTREPWMAWLHFSLLALCGLGLLFNRFPRMASFIAYVLTLSINHRISFATYGVDELLATIYLWMSFLPPGKPAGAKSNSFASLASLAVLLQIAYLYVFAGFMKSFDYWFVKGWGAYTALQADLYARPLGLWAAAHLPLSLMQFGSRAVLVWERFGPLLIFSPWCSSWCRIAVFLGFAAMHLSFAATMAIGIFPGVDLVFLILLLPGELWDRISARPSFQSLPRLKTYVREEAPLDLFAPAILAALFCVTVWNLKRLEWRVWVPKPVRWAANSLGLNQNWRMFAPTPFGGDGWYVIQGTSGSGRAVDVLRDKDGWADFRRPRVISAIFPSPRWYSNSLSFAGRSGEENRRAFANYFCQRWSGRADRLASLRVWFVGEPTAAPGDFQIVYSRLLIAQECSE